MRASIPTRQLRRRLNARVCSSWRRDLLGVPARCSAMRRTPSWARAWSLAAYPKPRSAATVAGGRPAVRPLGARPGAVVGRRLGVSWTAGGRRQAALVLAHQQGVAELGRLVRLAFADRAGVGVGKREQPVSDHPVAGNALAGLVQQPVGLGSGLRQPGDQPSQPAVTGTLAKRPAGVAGDPFGLGQGASGDGRDLGGEPVDLGGRLPGAPPRRVREICLSRRPAAREWSRKGYGWPRRVRGRGGPARPGCAPRARAGRRRWDGRCRPPRRWWRCAACGSAGPARRPALSAARG